MNRFFVLAVRNEISGAVVGPESGTKYSLSNACNACGTGANVTGRFFVSDRNFRHPVLCFSSGGSIVHDSLAAEFKALGVKSLHEVWKNDEKLDYFQIEGQEILPPFSPISKYFTWDLHCQACRRDGFFCQKEPLKLIYPSLPLRFSRHHVLATHEGFGYSFLREPFSQSHFAEPLLIVSEEIKGIFQGAKIDGVEFFPVVIEHFAEDSA